MNIVIFTDSNGTLRLALHKNADTYQTRNLGLPHASLKYVKANQTILNLAQASTKTLKRGGLYFTSSVISSGFNQ